MSLRPLALVALCGLLIHAHRTLCFAYLRRATGPQPMERLLVHEAGLPHPAGTDAWDPHERRQRFVTTLPADTHHAAGLRRTVRENLSAWRLAYMAEDVTLVTHELFVNAVEHGSSGPTDVVVVELRHSGRQLSVLVTDRSPSRRPMPCSVHHESERGRGMAIVGCLATSWQVVPQLAAKTVLATLSTNRQRS
jgi:anti-sigma regulatory factor (Ser/Thr protein kinase)